MVGVVFALLIYLLLDILLHMYMPGIRVMPIVTTLYGNEEKFIEPILIDSLLLQVHIDLFMSLFTSMIISSIYIRLYANKTFTKVLVHSLLILGLLAPLFLIVAYFTSVIFIYLWLGSFWVWHLLGIWLSLLIVKKLLFK